MVPTNPTGNSSIDYRTVPGAALTDIEREYIRATAANISQAFPSPTVVNICSVGWEAPTACLRAGAPNARLLAVVVSSYPDTLPASYCDAILLKADTATYGTVFDGDVHLLFIDGIHYAETVQADLDAWATHVPAGGYVLLHDYAPSNYNLHFHPDLIGVRNGVMLWYRSNSKYWEKVGITDSIIAFQRRAVPLDHDGEPLEPVIHDLASRVTAITVNYKTKDLTKTAISSFRHFYPDVHYILVDNFSRDDSALMILSYSKNPLYTVIANGTNVGHGPAMTQAIAKIKTPFFFTFDSDSEMLSAGMLEAMISRMESNTKLYALGWLRYVDKFSGVPHSWHVNPPPIGDRFIPYVHPCAGLYRLSMYQQLPAFQDHGAPCLDNMRVACENNMSVENFQTSQYMKHHEAGTRRMFHGNWHPGDKDNPGRWDAKQRFPI